MSWVPLHVYSQYTILDSSASIPALAERAAQLKIPALALTDEGNLYGAIEFYKACKGHGVKPIIGCELALAPGSRFEKKRIPGFAAGYPLVLIAKNKEGYQNLCILSSQGFLEGFYYTPRIDKELLFKHREGLICLSGSLQGRFAQLALLESDNELVEEIAQFKEVFKEDFYLEIQRHAMSAEAIREDGIDKEPWLLQSYQELVQRQEQVIARYRELSKKMGVACVATQGSRYIDREDWRAHEILMNIQSGEPCEIWEKDSFGNPKARVLNPKRQTKLTHELYFKSPQQMEELFADFPEAVAATSEIAERCHFEFDFKAKYYPVFVPPHLQGKEYTKEERVVEAEKFLKQLCEEGIATRYPSDKLAKVKEKYPDKEPLDVVRSRLAYELEVIVSKGMCDYLLIVYDFIAWAKRQGIPMGPGRGSGAGSIVLYLIGITDIEPIRFNLFFERFINPERPSYPDIDVDICMERRCEVIDYTVRTYGKERVAQIITFGTMKAKMAIKDVGRVLSVPLLKVNAITKLVPEDPNMTLEKALELDPDLRAQYQADEEVRRLIDIAKKLEGSVRNTGIHAAGLIISAEPLMEVIPVCNAKDSDIAATQFSMKPVEAVGMLKIDFLGLKTLTSIQKTAEAVKTNYGRDIDWVNLSLDDRTTFELLNQGKTLGIFQLESPGMQELAKQLHIDKFEEIIAVGALYRPGPMEMIPSFINRKHKRETIEIDHPLMQDILSETYGIMVYQEQVMQIASLLASYTLGEGDVLRRAMGKKDKEEMARQREKFREGALRKGIDAETSMRIFDKVEKFASYGFNKSHAAAYGYLTYVTAFFKANYPKEWMAALMTSDREDISKVSKIIRECQTMEIAILSPDVNESGAEFAATPRGIRFAMTAIKGVGEGVVNEIVQERTKSGPYLSLYNFMKRIDTSKVGKKVIENLIEAGCFDFTGWDREAMLASVDPMYAAAARDQKESSRGVMNLFALMGEDEEALFAKPPEVAVKPSRQKTLKREYELLGFYLTGHPMDEFREMLQKLSCIPLENIVELESGSVCRCAFILDSVQVKISSKNQRKFAILTISDGQERLELPIWSEMFEEKHHLLLDNQLIYAVLQVEHEKGELKLHCRWLGDLTQVNEEMIKACDAAYDKSKLQSKHSDFREKRAAQRQQEPKKMEQPAKDLFLKADIDALRMSHILELKKLFRAFPGKSKIQIGFYSSGAKIGEVAIDAAWGIQWNSKIEESLRKDGVFSIDRIAAID